ncbi:MAG: hypothetical protein FWK04_12075 [Nostoc sp. GBBB01]|nr:hypothetical protein [Nostoc sp. GBBB01]
MHKLGEWALGIGHWKSGLGTGEGEEYGEYGECGERGGKISSPSSHISQCPMPLAPCPNPYIAIARL